MGYFNKIINIFRASHEDKHIWDVRIGEKKFRIQDVLNNYDLIGTSKEEIDVFFKKNNCYRKATDEWIYEVKNNSKGIYLVIISFEEEKPVKINYSYIK